MKPFVRCVDNSVSTIFFKSISGLIEKLKVLWLMNPDELWDLKLYELQLKFLSKKIFKQFPLAMDLRGFFQQKLSIRIPAA